MSKIVYSIFYLISLLPFCVLYALSDIAYLLIYKLIGYRRTVVRNNLTTSFPEKDIDEITKSLSKAIENLVPNGANKKALIKNISRDESLLFLI